MLYLSCRAASSLALLGTIGRPGLYSLPCKVSKVAIHQYHSLIFFRNLLQKPLSGCGVHRVGKGKHVCSRCKWIPRWNRRPIGRVALGRRKPGSIDFIPSIFLLCRSKPRGETASEFLWRTPSPCSRRLTSCNHSLPAVGPKNLLLPARPMRSVPTPC